MNSKLIDFIVKNTHLKAGDIRPELRLAEDIGYYGLDAILFTESFFSEFEIKDIESFDIDLHIDGSVDFAPRPLNWIKNVVNKERRKYLRPDVTLGHLDKVIEKGSWYNER
ncbi:MAG TPA: hypothetical protein PLO42_21155 [Cyclobacteriaceae bacterium]|nr:hypothetical protein [Cyclobacteriaceae bacterium]